MASILDSRRLSVSKAARQLNVHVSTEVPKGEKLAFDIVQPDG